MAYEIIYDKKSGHIHLTRQIAAPRKDLTPREGQGKLFLNFDFGERPVSAYRVNPEKGTIELRDDYVELERDVFLKLSTDAVNTSPIDNSPEILADGKSKVTITIQKWSRASDRPLTGARHNNLITIRTTAGTLSTRQVKLDKGQAKFNLTSSTQTVVAKVRVWAEEIPQPATIRIEFAPVP